ncbi:uncharacterized protein Z520_08931 [Fonsecaea multimorphosa CBS 102226]|uniref:Histidine kinase group protein n=1 Tax=Fonsecaea multimorphosa CBS 102226 TaxID=1442371 RepID=A0A0D2JY29_9EURO|nr:uncharacterized protein Z520_08931 [Fonsecaea multimorphosa CBS 102226]KIX95414.1 hypothetical protein Z520_08931 [Fonsecaea multimorphosa CBS 102226]OAL20945.1 hypothetical protein AYO22_08365 [Fonsecaea multimorphosa]
MTRKKPKPKPDSPPAQPTTQSAEGESALGAAKQETPSPGSQPPPVSLKLVQDRGRRTTDLTAPSALVICRNKHWKHISSYHGPWLGFPIEVLESLAYSNYACPRPQPIHPAVLFDLVKIRRLIDEATSLAVRAANGTSTSDLQTSLQSSKGMFYGNDAEMLGLSSPRGLGHTKLSRERRHRMRDHATQKLYQAYSFDEIAASVVMMQSASALEGVAKLVLEREEHNPYAQYVHFFHEKIPCMGLVEHTSLDSLTDVISQKPTDSSPYRTRAVTRMFMDDLEGVVRDCTDGLTVNNIYHSKHKKNQQDLVLPKEAAALGQEFQPKGRVADDDQPSSMELQLLCLRGTAYLTLACKHIRRALHGLAKSRAQQADDGMNPAALDSKEDKQCAEARKLVRTYAKRALRDYLSYLSHFEYTPGYPLEYTAHFLDGFSENVTGPAAGHRSRGERLLDVDSHTRTGMSDTLVRYEGMKDRLKKMGRRPMPTPPIYKLNELFAAVPPADVPAYAPERDKEIDPHHPVFSLPDFAEAVSFHPLMMEVLHCLLLCHCLIQTSTKEIQRHAYMVARIARVCDGYPVFLTPRSLARADWIEILTRTDNWIGLADSWRNLCTPLYLATYLKSSAPKDRDETSEENRLRIRHTALMQAFADEGILEEELVKAEHKARKPRAAYKGEETAGKELNRTNMMDCNESGGVGNQQSPSKAAEEWPAEGEGECPPSSTERADAIVQWILEAPRPSASNGTGRSKKKPGVKGKSREMSGTASNLRETEMTAVEQNVKSLDLVE